MCVAFHTEISWIILLIHLSVFILGRLLWVSVGSQQSFDHCLASLQSFASHRLRGDEQLRQLYSSLLFFFCCFVSRPPSLVMIFSAWQWRGKTGNVKVETLIGADFFWVVIWCKPPAQRAVDTVYRCGPSSHRITPDQVLRGESKKKKKKEVTSHKSFCSALFFFCKESHRGKQIPLWVYHFLTDSFFYPSFTRCL